MKCSYNLDYNEHTLLEHFASLKNEMICQEGYDYSSMMFLCLVKNVNAPFGTQLKTQTLQL